MKAVVSYSYGDPALEEIERPEVDHDRVLVRVHAAGVNPLDYHEVRGTPYFARPMLGLRRPKNSRRGVDAAGTVEAVGSAVTLLEAGDEVFGACRGAFAEYALGTERGLAKKPPSLRFEQAASVPVAGVTALQALRTRDGVKPGHKVLVNGAAGGVGIFAVQIAKASDAEVTGVCSTRNVELVRSLGADHVVDYTVEDFTRNGHEYDRILNAVDSRTWRDLKRALAPDGTLVLVSGSLMQMLQGFALQRFMRRKIVPFMATVTREDLEFLAGLFEAGKLVPVIDRTYALPDAAEAIRYVEAGHARGKVVVTI